MGFKQLSHETPKQEDIFVNSARGETNKTTEKAKREKKLLVNFTEEEYQILKRESSLIGLGLNSYVRFKIFRNDQDM